MKSFTVGFLFILNLFSFFLVGYDKQKAKNRGWRVREKTFFTIALFGGAIGVYVAMKTFRHKTKHVSFSYGIPLLVVINIIIFVIYFSKGLLRV